MRKGVLEFLLVVGLLACGVLLASEAWSGSSSYADSKETFDVVFTYTSADSVGDIGTAQNACRSGVAYLEDGGTGTARLHATPGAGSTVSASTALGDLTSAGLAGAITFDSNPSRYLKLEKLSAGEGTVRIRCANFVVARADLLFSVGFEGAEGSNCAGIVDDIGGAVGVPQTGTDCNFSGLGTVEGLESLLSTGAHYIDFLDSNTDMSGHWTSWASYFIVGPSGFRGVLRPLTSIGVINNPRVQTDASLNLSLNCNAGSTATLVTLASNTQYWFKQYWDRDTDEYKLVIWDNTGTVLDYEGTCDGLGTGLRIGADNNAVAEVHDIYQIWDGDPGNISKLYPEQFNQAVAVGAPTSTTAGLLDGSGSSCPGGCTYAWTEATAFGCVIAAPTSAITSFSGCTAGTSPTFELTVDSSWPAATDQVTVDLGGVSLVFPYTLPFALQ